MDKLRVLVVDDTSLYRMIVTHALQEIEDVEFVGSAPNGKIALDKVAQLKPDLVTLDVEMPEMDGIETLARLKETVPDVGVVMVSSLTQQGAETTMKALELGAFDFLGKPVGATASENKDRLGSDLKQIINAYITQRYLSSLRSKHPAPKTPPQKQAAPPVIATTPLQAVVVGISTGGPNALTEMIPQLPGDLRVPVLLVQHMPETFTAALARSLDNKSAIRVVEGQHAQRVEPATVYIAPGGKQMKAVSMGNTVQLMLTDDPPENYCRPAVDYMMRSVADIYGAAALGVIMTGMGADGKLGVQQMKIKGSKILAQDEETSVVFGMPMEAIKTGVVDLVLPLGSIAGQIARLVGS